MLEGMLVVDKPTGMTSFDVIRRLRRLLGLRALGHTGTLDPNASGVLCVCVGWALKLLRFLDDDHKVYSACAKLGEVTDTDDAEGEVIACHSVAVSEDDVAAELHRLVGIIDQVPPQYSAVKVDGRRAYAQARKGKEVTLSPRKVRIDRIDADPYVAPFISFRVACGKGTYIRSLCRDLGAALGCGAHLSTLRRLESGGATIDQACTFEQLDELVQLGTPLPVVTCWDMLSHLPAVDLSPEAALAISHGRRPQLPEHHPLDTGTIVRLRPEPLGDTAQPLLAVAQVEEGRLLRPIRVRPQAQS